MHLTGEVTMTSKLYREMVKATAARWLLKLRVVAGIAMLMGPVVVVVGGNVDRLGWPICVVGFVLLLVRFRRHSARPRPRHLC